MRLVVIGGGITGLAAAVEASASGDVDVTVVERASSVGGKLERTTLAGVTVDTGAESLLATRPEAVDLAHEVGLGDRIVHPATTRALLWTRGSLVPLPPGLVLGVPSDPEAVIAAGVLDAAGVRRLTDRVAVPPSSQPRSIGDVVAAAVGDEIVDRLVDPLLAGVYAGDPRALDLSAVAPSLAAALTDGGDLVDAARAARRAPTGPVFAGIVGGVGLLPSAAADLVERRGGRVLTDTSVLGLRRTGDGWAVQVSAAEGDAELEADAVVIAVPAPAAADLLAAHTDVSDLEAIEYASVGVVTLALPASAEQLLPASSGFLVPSVDGRVIKAATFSTRKWAWTAEAATAAPDSPVVLRTSVGRWREPGVLEQDDAGVVEAAVAGLSEALGSPLEPLAAHVRRWDRSLPQYLVGHPARVARIRAGIAGLPRVAIAGAGYDGIGIAACIASGRGAARGLIDATGGRGRPPVA